MGLAGSLLPGVVHRCHLAPTHPHAAAAGSPTAQKVLGPFAAMVDKVRDTLHQQHGRARRHGVLVRGRRPVGTGRAHSTFIRVAAPLTPDAEGVSGSVELSSHAHKVPRRFADPPRGWQRRRW